MSEIHIEDLAHALNEDFKELLQPEFTTNWKVERFLIEMYLSVMSLDNTMKLINEQNKQLKDVINEVREYIEELKSHWLGNDLVLKIIDDLLQILDKVKVSNNE